MSSVLPAWVVQVTCAETVSAGFLIASGVAATTAHGVATAGPLTVQFQGLNGGPSFDANIIEQWSDDGRDVAFLGITDSSGAVPPEVALIDLPQVRWSSDITGRAFTVFGFPVNGPPGGGWGTGTIAAITGLNHMQLTPREGEGYRIVGGFSGSPLIDADDGVVLGLVVGSDPSAMADSAVTADLIIKLMAEVGLKQGQPVAVASLSDNRAPASSTGQKVSSDLRSVESVSTTSGIRLDHLFDHDPSVSLPTAQSFSDASPAEVAGVFDHPKNTQVQYFTARMALAKQPVLSVGPAFDRLANAQSDWHGAKLVPSALSPVHCDLMAEGLVNMIKHSERDVVRLSIEALGQVGAVDWAFVLGRLYEECKRSTTDDLQPYRYYLVSATAQMLVASESVNNTLSLMAMLERMVRDAETDRWSDNMERFIFDRIAQLRPWHADALVREWSDADLPMLRMLAMHALGEMRLTRYREVVRSHLTDPSEDDQVRRYAALALANIGGDGDAACLIPIRREVRDSSLIEGLDKAIAISIESAPEELVDEAVHLVDGAREWCYVLRSLGRRGSLTHLDVVRRGLTMSDPSSRALATLAMARLVGAEALSDVVRARDEAGSTLERVASGLALVLIDESAGGVPPDGLRRELTIDSYSYGRPLRDDIVEVLETSASPEARSLGHAWRVIYEGPAGLLP